MKFFVDTANLDELKKGAAWGIVDGVTTRDGIKACSSISKERIRINVTLCFSAAGALLAANAGAHIGTMPFKVLDMMFNYSLTDKGLEQFLPDYQKVFQEEPVAGR